ncbi:hypothetical protein [Micromonospora tarensis]|uniref:hypothetical protein n=1 Tax=Micromonospora tarensis TaxID=2806100 RepID=UPI001EE467BB|nr:hypothetical protein [Micromonospora tarensis]
MAGEQRPQFVDGGGPDIGLVVDAGLGGTRHRGRGMAARPQHVHHVGADQTTATDHQNPHTASSTPQAAPCQATVTVGGRLRSLLVLRDVVDVQDVTVA